jgi:hypothetical protein
MHAFASLLFPAHTHKQESKQINYTDVNLLIFFSKSKLNQSKRQFNSICLLDAIQAQAEVATRCLAGGRVRGSFGRVREGKERAVCALWCETGTINYRLDQWPRKREERRKQNLALKPTLSRSASRSDE